ncbi:MAG: GHMP kinase [Bacteroidetes bacterium HGW-Bacteroidetes-16]|jgi:mevalonate kinase|nr:MAG: GHMP kinase [Bacteroidetes bacterium HGW-Bacteroidetes-16]
MSNQWIFHANGKLLITGEYLVLEGARGLALPLKQGQHMQVNTLVGEILRWEAFSPEGLWFEATISLPDLNIISTSDPALAEKLHEILSEVFSAFLFQKNKGFHIITRLDFNPSHGFGSSATLVSLLAQWIGLDAFKLHHKLFGGSGYDIACATAFGPIIYSIENEHPLITPTHFFPPFHQQLYFVYLGNKQHSSREIARFKEQSKFKQTDIEHVNSLTEAVCHATNLDELELALMEHEALLSVILKKPVIKQERFKNYQGVVKSLGAWGGDFVMATTRKDRNSFVDEMKQSGFEVVYPFAELVLSRSSKIV